MARANATTEETAAKRARRPRRRGSVASDAMMAGGGQGRAADLPALIRRELVAAARDSIDDLIGTERMLQEAVQLRYQATRAVVQELPAAIDRLERMRAEAGSAEEREHLAAAIARLRDHLDSFWRLQAELGQDWPRYHAASEANIDALGALAETVEVRATG